MPYTYLSPQDAALASFNGNSFGLGDIFVELLARHEFHTEQQDSDWTAGNHFRFGWGQGNTINNIWKVGLAGYCSWQVADNWGKDAVSDREQTYTIGPEFGIFLENRKVSITLHSVVEFKNHVGSRATSPRCGS